MEQHYDVVVLGAGPGGYVAAIRCAELGLKTAIVEKRYWGGVCANVGCIPSKTLLHTAEFVHTLKNKASAYGVSHPGEISVDYATAFQHSRNAAERMAGGVQTLMKRHRIETYTGWATLTDPHHMHVALNTDETALLQFNHLILAPGAVDNTLPDVQLSERVVTYETQIMQGHLPQSIVIIGAGAIGVEFSYILACFGVDVTLIEYQDQLLPLEDADIGKVLQKAYQKLGINILTTHRVEAVDDSGDQVRVVARHRKTEQQIHLTTDRVLVAVGFKPRTTGYGLENAGVQLNDRGAIAINDRMQTNVPHIYAIGDVTGKLMLAHVAETMGAVAAEHISGQSHRNLDFAMMPRATYCQPQIASFGYTDTQARQLDYDVQIAKFPFSANGKAVGMGATTGFVKLIGDRKYGEILGAHMIGVGVTELLPTLTLARKSELTLQEIAENVHPHPTLSEAIKEAAHQLLDA